MVEVGSAGFCPVHRFTHFILFKLWKAAVCSARYVMHTSQSGNEGSWLEGTGRNSGETSISLFIALSTQFFALTGLGMYK